MSINKQCVLKYLKHDYTKIFGGVLLLICIIIAIVLAGLALLYLPQMLEFGLAYRLNIMSPVSAYVLLNVLAAIIVLASTVGIAIFGNKKWFEYKPWKEGYGWGPNDHEPKGFEVILLPVFGVSIIPYMAYWCGYFINDWESPVISTIVFILLILIGTPISCAIARCKEE